MEQCAYALMEATHGQTIDWTVQSVTPVGEGIERLSRIKVASEGNEYIGRFGWRSHPLLKKNIAKFEGDIILLTGPTLTSCAAVKHHQSKKILGIHFVHGTRA
ncbi:MAG: glycosyltransferase family 4 protein, partial [Phormidesmis sp. RL_2_1]|nr:glycosyltransferase family 4 protein [Phormidesmis sp. RL_2_1]